METKIVKVDIAHPEAKLIEEAGEVIRNEGLVAFPTETVYGLGGNAFDATSSAKIYAAKGRPSDNPLIVHIAEFSDVDKLAKHVSDKARKLMDAFWPGPLTMIFEKMDIVPKETTGGLDTVAIRMPAHDTALALIRQAGVPIAAPSANASGRPSPTCASHVAADLTGRIELILDGGSCDIGVESTIVDMTTDEPMILRPGYITREILEEEIGKVLVDPTILSADSKARPKAPGMKYRHYAPKAPLVLVDGGTDYERAEEEIRRLARQSMEEGRRVVGIIATEESLAGYEAFSNSEAVQENGAKLVIQVIGSRKNPESIARNLYDILRRFDDTEAECIYGEAFPADHLGQAIMNRLGKAAGHQILDLRGESV